MTDFARYAPSVMTNSKSLAEVLPDYGQTGKWEVLLHDVGDEEQSEQGVHREGEPERKMGVL